MLTPKPERPAGGRKTVRSHTLSPVLHRAQRAHGLLKRALFPGAPRERLETGGRPHPAPEKNLCGIGAAPSSPCFRRIILQTKFRLLRMLVPAGPNFSETGNWRNSFFERLATLGASELEPLEVCFGVLLLRRENPRIYSSRWTSFRGDSSAVAAVPGSGFL